MTEQSTEADELNRQMTNEDVSNVDTSRRGESPHGDANADSDNEEPETFPREYVQKLRDEAAKYRQRAGDRDTLAERLHVALVAATGRLADPSDLAFDESHLTDVETLSTALDELLTRKPHLASRRPVGDVGQGASTTADPVDLAAMLRRNAS